MLKYEKVEVIAGVATAGIPQGVLVADILNLPFIYVRSQNKSHGMKNLIEGKLFKQIIFGPECYHLRRNDGIPSVIEDFVFGKRIIILKEGWLLERWNTTELANIPDFDICLYKPEDDQLISLANIKCFDWHIASKDEKSILLKWFDGTQGGEVKVVLADG